MLLEVFDKLHIPVAVEKLEGPAMIIIFLGIKLDTQLMILRLPQEKLNELMTADSGRQRNFASKRTS